MLVQKLMELLLLYSCSNADGTAAATGTTLLTALGTGYAASTVGGILLVVVQLKMLLVLLL